MVLTQPVVYTVFQHRGAAIGAVALAMDNAYTADVLVPAAGDKLHHLMAGDSSCHAVHVQFGANGQLAASELLQFSLLDAGPGEKQGFIRRHFSGFEVIRKCVCFWRFIAQLPVPGSGRAFIVRVERTGPTLRRNSSISSSGSFLRSAIMTGDSLGVVPLYYTAWNCEELFRGALIVSPLPKRGLLDSND